MARLGGLIGFGDPLEVVRSFVAVVRCTAALLGCRGRGTIAAFDADAGRRVVRQRSLYGGSVDGPAGCGRASGSFLLFRACFPRAPLVEKFGCNVCDPYASAVMVKGWMSYTGDGVADGGSVRLRGVDVQFRWRRRRRHAVVIIIKGIHLFRYIRLILGH